MCVCRTGVGERTTEVSKIAFIDRLVPSGFHCRSHVRHGNRLFQRRAAAILIADRQRNRVAAVVVRRNRIFDHPHAAAFGKRRFVLLNQPAVGQRVVRARWIRGAARDRYLGAFQLRLANAHNRSRRRHVIDHHRCSVDTGLSVAVCDLQARCV